MAVLIGEQLTAWSKAGLLRRLGFVDHQALQGDGRLERLPQTVLEGGEVRSVDLFDWLAGNYCDLTRILAVHTDPTRNESVAVLKAAERCHQEVRARQGPQQRLVQIACYLGAPGHGEYDTKAVGPAFQNLVIVPVDQAMPGSGASPLAPREGEQPASRFASVAAQTIATISGAWLFQQEGALDDSTSGSAQTGIRVVRSYVRTLDVPDPVPELTDRTLNRELVDGGSGWPLPTGAASVVPANPPEHFARAAAKDLAGRHSDAIGLHRVAPPRAIETTPVRLLAAIRMFGSYLLTGLRAAPRLAVHRLSSAASVAATSAMFGQNSQFQIVVGRSSIRQPPSDLETVERTVSLALRDAEPAANYLPPPCVDLWREYALVGTALVDGSDLPPGLTRPSVGDSRAVIQQPGLVVADPAHPSFEISPSAFGSSHGPTTVIDAFDPRSVLVVRRDLVRIAGQAANDSDSESDPGDDDAFGDEADDDAPAGDSSPVAAAAEEKAEEGSSATDRQRRLATRALSELGDWVADIESTYSWKLGESIAGPLLEAEEATAAAAAVLSQGAPQQPSSDLDVRTKVLSSIGMSLLFGLIVGGWMYLTESRWQDCVVVGVVCVLIGLVIGFVSYLRALRRQFQAVHRYNQRIEDLNHAYEAFTKYSREVLRLSSLYWQYQRWTRVLAGLLHRPFGQPLPANDPGSALMISSEALAVRSAVAQLDQRGLDSKVHGLRRATFTIGWLQRAWGEAEGGITNEFCRDRAMDEPPDPLEDTLRRRSGLLDHLVAAVQTDEHGRVSRRNRTARIRELVSAYSLERIVRDVSIDGIDPYPDAIAPTNAREGDGLFGELIDFDAEGPQRYHHELWSSHGLDSSATVADSIVQTTPFLAEEVEQVERVEEVGRQLHQSVSVKATSPLQHAGRTLYGSSRVDLSETCQAKDLVLFRETADEQEKGWFEPVGEGD